MRPLLAALAALPTLLANPAAAQDLSIIAELPAAESGSPGSVKVSRLAPGGPLFVLSFGYRSVSAWPVGMVAEPIVTHFGGEPWAGGSPVLGDFDGDGFTDLALNGTNEIDILRGDGTGRFVPAAVLPANTQYFYVVGADFDGDGRPDLAAAQAFSPIVSVFISKGSFKFEAPRDTDFSATYGVGSLAAGDLDGDGRADLVVSPDLGSVSVWLGKGDGTFIGPTSNLTGLYPGPALLSDIDGDGRPDIVMYLDASRFPPFHVNVYRNDGGGLFHSIARFETNPYPYGSLLAVADVDGDGKPEVVFPEQDSTGAYLSLRTYEAGGFNSSRMSFPASPPLFFYAGTVADWSGDGRDELLLGTAGGVEVLGLSGARVDILAVPVLVSTTGLYGSRFDSDLLLTNSGTTAAHLTMRYIASKGGGSGAVERDIPVGQQLFAPSAVAFLRDAGLPISPEGNVVGTLRIETSGASSPRAMCATVRTTTPARAGVSYGGVPSLALLRSSSVVPWLIESAKDRTNLALVNAGSEADGPVTLRVTVFSGVPGTEAPVVMRDVVLESGAFFQFGRLLASAGLPGPVGWARIDRVGGSAPYLAWGAVNDAGSGDGSFVPAVAEEASLYGRWVVPNAAQTSRYGTEFVATNAGTDPLPLQVTLVATGAVLTETVAPRATFYLPDLFAEIRRRGLDGAPALGSTVVSPLYLQAMNGMQLFAGIRVSTTTTLGRSYGVFEQALASALPGGYSMLIPDLRQDENTRTNLGIVNQPGGPTDYRIDVFDGTTGALAGTTSMQLRSNELVQLNGILQLVAPGVTRAWARVTPIGSTPFFWPFAAYAILNDGATPGAGTDDGSYVAGVPQ